LDNVVDTHAETSKSKRVLVAWPVWFIRAKVVFAFDAPYTEYVVALVVAGLSR
jgi:hypothetical protein